MNACPLNWRTEANMGTKLVELAVDTCFFSLYEIERQKTTFTYNPEARGKKKPVSEWLKLMGKTKHLLAEENKDLLAEIQQYIDERWERLKG